jgi:hypothetical protein
MAQQMKSKPRQRTNGSRSSARSSTARGRVAAKSHSSTRRSQDGSPSRDRPRSTASSRRSKSKSSNSKGAMSAAKDTTVTGAKSAGNAVASTAKQLKTPAIAAGVGLAGLAGGIALGRGKNKKGFNIPLQGRSAAKDASKKLSSAAKNVDAVAERTGQIAERVRLVSDAVAGKAEKNTAPRRSPVEVLLEGLTRRSVPRA